SQRSSPVACGSGVTVEVPAIRGSGILFRFPDSWHYFCAALSPSLLGEEEPTIDGPVARRATCSDLCLRRLPRPVRLPRVADPFDPPVGGGATVDHGRGGRRRRIHDVLGQLGQSGPLPRRRDSHQLCVLQRSTLELFGCRLRVLPG